MRNLNMNRFDIWNEFPLRAKTSRPFRLTQGKKSWFHFYLVSLAHSNMVDVFTASNGHIETQFSKRYLQNFIYNHFVSVPIC